MVEFSGSHSLYTLLSATAHHITSHDNRKNNTPYRYYTHAASATTYEFELSDWNICYPIRTVIVYVHFALNTFELGERRKHLKLYLPYAYLKTALCFDFRKVVTNIQFHAAAPNYRIYLKLFANAKQNKLHKIFVFILLYINCPSTNRNASSWLMVPKYNIFKKMSQANPFRTFGMELILIPCFTSYRLLSTRYTISKNN